MDKTIARLLKEMNAYCVDEDGNVLTSMLVGKQIDQYTVAVIAECITALQPDDKAIGDMVKKIEDHFV